MYLLGGAGMGGYEMLGRLMCLFGYHDNELIPVELSYILVNNIWIMENVITDNKLKLGKRDTYFYRCKRCKELKEVGTL